MIPGLDCGCSVGMLFVVKYHASLSLSLLINTVKPPIKDTLY